MSRTFAAGGRVAAAVIGAGLWGSCVYRAWRQSITHDEALNYGQFAAQGWRKVFTAYEAGNHVLFGALQRLATASLGVSELTLRWPSLLGGLLFLIACHRICRRALGDGWRLPVAFLALGLNPLVLDHLSAARGYGLGLGLMMWGLAELLAWWEGENPWRLFRAGVSLGLAVAAVPVYLYPAAALWAITPVMLGRKRFWYGVEWFTGPGVLAAFVLLVIPLSRLGPEAFYFGTSTLGQFATRMVDLSFIHDPRIWLADPELRAYPWAHWAFLHVVVPVFLALGLGAAAGKQKLSRIVGATLGLALLMLALGRLTLGLLLPNGRTGLYLLPLFTLAIVALFAKERPRALAWPALAFTAASVVMYAAAWTTSYYAEWHFDSRTREAIELMEKRRERRETRVAVSWLLRPAVEHYRQRYGASWLTVVPADEATGDCDYYYLLMTEAGKAPALGTTVFYDPVAQTLLAGKP